MSYPPANWKRMRRELDTLVLDKIMWLSNLRRGKSSKLGQRQVFRCD